MGNAAAPQKAIRQSQSLCAGEQEYVHKRKQKVMKRLNSLKVNCTTNNVPHIALLGSGGGQRADVGFMGTLYQMEKEGLLDTLVYLGGISGSTWCMSSVYKDPEWSSNMDRAMSRLFGSVVEMEQVLDWLYKQMNNEDFSLSDVWGALTSAVFIKEMDQRHLSDEARRNAFNPYPIYNAIEKDCFTHGPTEGKWFEFSPHQAGFTELGFFIETSLLGSKFKGGELLEKKPEMDMIRLEGILGSALASGKVIKEYILDWLKGILDSASASLKAKIEYILDWLKGILDSAWACWEVIRDYILDWLKEKLAVLAVLDEVIAVTRNPTVIPPVMFDLGTLQDIPEVTKANQTLNLWVKAKSPEERNRCAKQWSLEMLTAVETWTLRGQEEDIAVLDEVIAMTRNPTVIPPVVFDLGPLQKIPEVTKANQTLNLWVEAKSPEERNRLAKQWSLEMLDAVETWTQSQQKGGFIDKAVLIEVTRNPTVIPAVIFGLDTLQDIPEVKLVVKIIRLISRWEWGTTKNFLYQQDPTVPTYLSSKEIFHLIDAGLQMNVPYPAFLGDRRDIDLIIAPDYSSGKVFETLTLARDYAAEVKKPFPEIDDKILEERDWPKDCYVFEGKEKEPTIVYMPLFNSTNCKDAAEVKAKMDEFSTFQLPYSKEKIESLLETVQANVKNNKETLLKEINKAVRRRGKK